MIADAFVCGAHSNIPLCCQIFYESPWKTMRENNMLPRGHSVQVAEYKFTWKGDWYHGDNEYVLCPECIVRIMEKRFKPHKIKDCTCAHRSS